MKTLLKQEQHILLGSREKTMSDVGPIFPTKCHEYDCCSIGSSPNQCEVIDSLASLPSLPFPSFIFLPTMTGDTQKRNRDTILYVDLNVK